MGTAGCQGRRWRRGHRGGPGLCRVPADLEALQELGQVSLQLRTLGHEHAVLVQNVVCQEVHEGELGQGQGGVSPRRDSPNPPSVPHPPSALQTRAGSPGTATAPAASWAAAPGTPASASPAGQGDTARGGCSPQRPQTPGQHPLSAARLGMGPSAPLSHVGGQPRGVGGIRAPKTSAGALTKSGL